jgi:predicted RNA binding protein YcfA (HicA-like mRNA interferase family)
VSKKDKLLSKLFATPPPKGFAWDDLITVMTRAGFSNECDGGSHYTFEHKEGLRLTMSRTHPSGLLKPYQVKSAKEAIYRTGGRLDQKDGNK